jgi:hypothetical protein
MSKLSGLVKKYRSLYPDDDVMVAGSWIKINGNSFRSIDVRRMIDDYKPPLKPLKEYDIYGLDEIHEPKQLTDIGELAKEIRSKADKIRHSHNRNEMRRKGHEIVKLAKRIINLQEK